MLKLVARRMSKLFAALLIVFQFPT